VNCSELGQNAAAAASPSVVLAASSAEVHKRIRNPRWCLEGWEQLISDVLRLVSEERVASESVSGEQASNESDVRFEDGNIG
jgi:hypothetical protein